MLTLYRHIEPPDTSIYLQLIDSKMVELYFKEVSKIMEIPAYLDFTDVDSDWWDVSELAEIFSTNVSIDMFDSITEKLSVYSKASKKVCDKHRISKYLLAVDHLAYEYDEVVECMERTTYFYKLFRGMSCPDSMTVVDLIVPYVEHVYDELKKTLKDLPIESMRSALLSFPLYNKDIYLKLEMNDV